MRADGRALLLYQDVGDGHGDIYLSTYNGRHFSSPRKLGGAVNSYARESHAALSPDGRTLYFSSDRAGGFGGLDIYRASLSGDSAWTNVRNLGDSVNSQFDEDTPFMSADGLTLFFSSSGRSSMGGYDVFVSRMNAADSTFSATENLGYPVNGTSDDLGFVLTANGRTGYLGSARKEGRGLRDIYEVQPALSRPQGVVCLLSGVVTASGRPAAAQVTAHLLPGGVATFAYTDSVEGRYLLVLPAGSRYRVSCRSGAFPVDTFTVDTRTLTVFEEKVHNFELREIQPVVAAPVVETMSSAVSSTTVAWPDKDGFIPQTLLQKKTMRYLQRYGKVTAQGLVFRVQFAAVKGQGNLYFPKLARVGRIERLRLGDGFTRMTVGGNFRSLAAAFAVNKKAIRAGQDESFVIAMYKGKRVQFEELESMGIFK